MTLAQIERALFELTTRPGRGALIRRRIQEACSEPWFDAECLENVNAAFSSLGLPLLEAGFTAFEPGETWLLLIETAGRRGAVARLRVTDSPVHRDLSGLWGPDSQTAARNAHRGLCADLGKIARSLGSEFVSFHFTASSADVSAQIEGSSLGVAVCVALASHTLGQPLPSDIAATAAVRADGSLAPVEFLDEKLKGLRRSQPGVRRVVVAEGQPCPESVDDSLELVECSTVGEAFVHFGLSPEQLPELDIDDLRKEVAGFSIDDRSALELAEWERLAERAMLAYRRLVTEGDADEQLNALRWAILFSAHAGDGEAIQLLVAERAGTGQGVPVVGGSEAACYVAIFSASGVLDGDPVKGLEMAQSALQLTVDADHKGDVLARATGTLGRALMHNGRFAEGATQLRRAVELQSEHEKARSLTYLATCLRLAGHASEALSTIEEAFARLHGKKKSSSKTRAYAALERGRCLLALGRAEEAVVELETAAKSCEADHDHPRSAALRGLASCHDALGHDEESATCYEACLRVAGNGDFPPILRRVSAMATVDRLAAGEPLSDRENTIVLELFPGVADMEAARASQRGWVY